MSATSPSSILGRCVVCGKESLKGCSKCKAAGLDWMYFCSVDHQRLIWKVHRRVCGENPFKFPLLNSDEAKELRSLQGEAYPGSNSDGKTWSEVIVDDLSPEDSPNGGSGRSRTSEDLDKKFQRVVLAAQSPCLPDPTFHNTFIAYLRASIFSVKSHRIPPLSGSLVSFEDTRQLLLEDPFGLLARLLSVYIDDSTRPILGKEWRSDFQHRLLILIARLQAEVKSEPHNPGRYSLSEERMNELKPLMRACNLIPSSKPTETNLEIFNQLMSDVFEFAGYELEFELCRGWIRIPVKD
ncbi:hypothetical protein JCM5350_008326 [Sporobolomyces pararoseus]